jgi:hypothetical protein
VNEPTEPIGPIGPVEARWTGAPVQQGQRGRQGEKGERGERGLPRAQRRAVIYLFLLNVLFVAACFAGLVHYVRSSEQERCASLAQIITIPIPVPVTGNPSRQAWASFEAVERRRGHQLGCALPPPRYVQATKG